MSSLLYIYPLKKKGTAERGFERGGIRHIWKEVVVVYEPWVKARGGRRAGEVGRSHWAFGTLRVGLETRWDAGKSWSRD